MHSTFYSSDLYNNNNKCSQMKRRQQYISMNFTFTAHHTEIKKKNKKCSVFSEDYVDTMMINHPQQK